MAVLSITIPDAIAARVIDGFAAAHGYTGTTPEGAAETKAQYLKRIVSLYVKESVKRAEIDAAVAEAALNSKTAASVADAAAETEIVLS